MTDAEREFLFWALLLFTLLCAMFGAMGWLAECLERWTGSERRKSGKMRGRFF